MKKQAVLDPNTFVEEKVLTIEQKMEMGKLAGEHARAHILKACEDAGLTVGKVAATVARSLDAKQVRVQLDMKGNWKVSDPFEDFNVQLKGVERAEVLLDLKPSIKATVDVVKTLSDDELDRRLALLLEQGGK